MVAATNEIYNKLQKFWEMEEISEDRVLTEIKQKCIKYFESTITIQRIGTTIRRLP